MFRYLMNCISEGGSKAEMLKDGHMSEVIRNDIFHFASTENVPTGFYRLCKQNQWNPFILLPNLLVVAEGNNDAIPPCF